MTRLVNDPQAFADEALSGYVASNEYYVRKVHGGVVRSTRSSRGEVAVVVGGGTGHYPAFAGWVGPGFAHGAACGNIFASPSASQVASVARHADNGGGVIFGFGNYTGDKLHFGLAAEQLRNEGMDVRILTVTDDVASGPADSKSQRRGIAGGLVVLKIMCAAAEAGLDIDEVERIGRKANSATASLGIAFSGCTLPGADAPLFTVADGTMAVGMGIHGERGISKSRLENATGVANVLLDGVFGDSPWKPGEKLALVLNGLGTIKYEELFVVYNIVHQKLDALKLKPLNPLVGEYVTSLDMGGLSLTATHLDEELAQYWMSPCDTPSFKFGPSVPKRELRPVESFELPRRTFAAASPESRRLAQLAVAGLALVKETVVRHADYLGDIDAVAGDGDHGIGMVRGVTAALEAARGVHEDGAGMQDVLSAAADAWAEHAGGTSGALWGAGLSAMAREFGNDGGMTDQKAVEAAQAFVDSVMKVGGAGVGDKTMVDSAVPFARELKKGIATSKSLCDALCAAALVAKASAENTAAFAARLGRARAHGGQSIGTPDAGAVSFALIVGALADSVSGKAVH
jgi:dihydroxyacetone kinase